METELDIRESDVGLLLSVFFGVASMVSPSGGRIAERVGARRALMVASTMSALVMAGMGVVASSTTILLVLMGLAGLAQGLAQPATHLAVAKVDSRRRAWLFGIKQSSIPTSSLIAGASVPLVGVTLGWRWTFLFGAVLAGLVAVLMPRFASGRAAPVPTDRRGDVPIAPLVMIGIAGGAGAAAGTALPAFLVQSAVSTGITAGSAGWLLVAGSMVCIVARLVVGWVADDHVRHPLLAVGHMLAMGSVGFLMLASTVPAVVVAGVLVGFAFGWGWQGLYHFSVVRINPTAPGIAAGIGQAGASAGAAAGPLAFGVVVSHSSFTTGWLFAAGGALAAAATVYAARPWVRRARAAVGAG